MPKEKFSYQLIGGSNIVSNPESAERFKEGQAEWIKFSEETINQVINLLPTLTNDPHPIRTVRQNEVLKPMVNSEHELQATKIGKLLLFLAKRRQEIAQKLKHGATDVDQLGHTGRTQEYGDIRYYSKLFSSNRMKETFLRDGDETWASQREVFFKEIDSLLLDAEYSKEHDAFYYDDNKNDKPYRISSQKNEKNELYFIIDFKFHLPDDIKLSNGCYSNETINLTALITLDPSTQKPRAERIKLEYVEPDKWRLPGDMEIANVYLERMLLWEKGEGLDVFMKNAAHLAQHLLCLLPMRLGTAGCIEWMLRSLAFNKGIVLGDFNQNNGISWDFKALATPNREKYAEWFATKVFNSITLMPESVSAPLIQSTSNEIIPPSLDKQLCLIPTKGKKT